MLFFFSSTLDYEIRLTWLYILLGRAGNSRFRREMVLICLIRKEDEITLLVMQEFVRCYY